MQLSSALLVASICACVQVAHGFLPASPVTSSSASSRTEATRDLTTSPTALNAVLSGGDPVDSDKPKLRLPNTCDSDYDCDGSEFCCEFMFFKMCCSDGWKAENDWVPVPVPIPVPIDPYYGRGGYDGYR